MMDVPKGNFKTVTICGSMRFKAEMLQMAEELSRKGWLVYFPFVTFTREEQENGHPDKEMLDQMHFEKIDQSEAIFVVNPGGYHGLSTQNEINHAWKQGNVIYSLEPIQDL